MNNVCNVVLFCSSHSTQHHNRNMRVMFWLFALILLIWLVFQNCFVFFYHEYIGYFLFFIFLSVNSCCVWLRAICSAQFDSFCQKQTIVASDVWPREAEKRGASLLCACVCVLTSFAVGKCSCQMTRILTRWGEQQMYENTASPCPPEFPCKISRAMAKRSWFQDLYILYLYREKITVLEKLDKLILIHKTDHKLSVT